MSNKDIVEMIKKASKPSSRQKWMISLFSGLLFLLISSPYLYSIVNGFTSKLGYAIASQDGCPNIYGLILHTIVFILVVRLVMV